LIIERFQSGSGPKRKISADGGHLGCCEVQIHHLLGRRWVVGGKINKEDQSSNQEPDGEKLDSGLHSTPQLLPWQHRSMELLRRHQAASLSTIFSNFFLHLFACVSFFTFLFIYFGC